jgi:dihydrodipicolinate synthase/N-acetylneuraminate lyase
VRLTRWKFGVAEEEFVVGGQDAAVAGNVIAGGGGVVGAAVEIAPAIAIAGENVNATGRALKSCSIQRLWLER